MPVRKKLPEHNGSEGRKTKEYMGWTLGPQMRTYFCTDKHGFGSSPLWRKRDKMDSAPDHNDTKAVL